MTLLETVILRFAQSVMQGSDEMGDPLSADAALHWVMEQTDVTDADFSYAEVVTVLLGFNDE